jgi:hypothetical protein
MVSNVHRAMLFLTKIPQCPVSRLEKINQWEQSSKKFSCMFVVEKEFQSDMCVAEFHKKMVNILY